MSRTRLAVVRTEMETREAREGGDEAGPLASTEVSEDHGHRGHDKRADDALDGLKGQVAELQHQVGLLAHLVEISDEAHQETKREVEHWKYLHGLASSTATLYEDLYRGGEARGLATGLVVALAVTVAGAAGYLLALAQLGSFLR
jgi:hypothetical protein